MSKKKLRIEDYGPDMDVIHDGKQIGGIIVDEDGYYIEAYVENVLSMVGFNRDFNAAVKAVLLLNDLDESLATDMERVYCDP